MVCYRKVLLLALEKQYIGPSLLSLQTYLRVCLVDLQKVLLLPSSLIAILENFILLVTHRADVRPVLLKYQFKQRSGIGQEDAIDQQEIASGRTR